MKNFIKVYRALLLLTIVFLLVTMSLKAQTRADSAVNNISGRLSVSKEKARQIYAANNYKRAEFEKLMKDNSRKPGDKQRQMKRLMAERKHMVDSVMTPAQKAALLPDSNTLKQKMAAHREEIMKRHEAEMDKVPHKHMAKINRPDTVNKKKVRTN
jgi:hypothetical protein